MVPVDAGRRLAAALVPPLNAIHHRAFEDQLGGLVGFGEPEAGEPLQGIDGLGEAALIEPGLAGGFEVDAVEGGAQVAAEQHLTETVAAAGGGKVAVGRGVRPTHGNELIDEGLFDELELRAAAHGFGGGRRSEERQPLGQIGGNGVHLAAALTGGQEEVLSSQFLEIGPRRLIADPMTGLMGANTVSKSRMAQGMA